MLAPSACRYLGMRRIQSSSPAPIVKVAIKRMTRLRLRPKNSAIRRHEFMSYGPLCGGTSECHVVAFARSFENPRLHSAGARGLEEISLSARVAGPQVSRHAHPASFPKRLLP